jgi:hypothetical protein
LRLLERKFGPLRQPNRPWVLAAELDDLEGWADRIIDAATIKDIFTH